MTSKRRADLEKHLEERCCAYAEAFGYEHIKLDKAKRKWPDRLLLGPNGATLLVEFKRPGEEPRKQQAAFHNTLSELGHQVHVIDTFDDFTQLILTHQQYT